MVVPKTNIKWMWCTQHNGKSCYGHGNAWHRIDISNRFIEPSFEVNDTREVKLRFLFDMDSYSYRIMDMGKDRNSCKLTDSIVF
jgi:hypothetical protein